MGGGVYELKVLTRQEKVSRCARITLFMELVVAMVCVLLMIEIA